MTTINVYLTFPGNCKEAFTFYKDAFGGEFSYVGTYAEMPSEEGFEISEEEKNRIMHISLPISQETILMGCDYNSQSGKPNIGNNFSININPADKSEADRLFVALSEGGEVAMPLEDTFWGAYFGMFQDKFGINWMVNFETQSQ